MKTHLQGIGKCQAIFAKDLKEGDIMVCNFGITQTVTEIRKRTEKSVFLTVRSESGKLYETRYLNTRLVAIKQ